MIHPVLLDGINRRIHIPAAMIEISSVDMDHQGLAADLLRMNTGRISQLIVSMDNIELFCPRHDTGHY